MTTPRSAEADDGDAVRLSQVVSNLLNNASKFSPAHGAIELTVASQGEEAVVTVKDNGMGFRPSLLVGERAGVGQRERPGEKRGMALGRLLGPLVPLVPATLRPVAAADVALAATGRVVVLSGKMRS